MLDLDVLVGQAEEAVTQAKTVQVDDAEKAAEVQKIEDEAAKATADEVKKAYERMEETNAARLQALQQEKEDIVKKLQELADATKERDQQQAQKTALEQRIQTLQRKLQAAERKHQAAQQKFEHELEETIAKAAAAAQKATDTARAAEEKADRDKDKAVQAAVQAAKQAAAAADIQVQKQHAQETAQKAAAAVAAIAAARADAEATAATNAVEAANNATADIAMFTSLATESLQGKPLEQIIKTIKQDAAAIWDRVNSKYNDKIESIKKAIEERVEKVNRIQTAITALNQRVQQLSQDLETCRLKQTSAAKKHAENIDMLSQAHKLEVKAKQEELERLKTDLKQATGKISIVKTQLETNLNFIKTKTETLAEIGATRGVLADTNADPDHKMYVQAYQMLQYPNWAYNLATHDMASDSVDLNIEQIVRIQNVYNALRMAIPAVRMYAKVFRDPKAPAQTPIFEKGGGGEDDSDNTIKVLGEDPEIEYGPYQSAPQGVGAEKSTNKGVFEELNDVLLDESNAQVPVVMAYGYSGSGKTYTMIEGDAKKEEKTQGGKTKFVFRPDLAKDQSLIHRFLVEKVMKTPAAAAPAGESNEKWFVTFHECYGWAPHALRVEDPTFEHRYFVSKKSADGTGLVMTKLNDFEEGDKDSKFEVNNPKAFFDLYTQVMEQRKEQKRTAATPNNPESSRSHLIIDFTSDQDSKAVFVDMAGTEDSVLMGEYMTGLKEKGDPKKTDTDTRSRKVLPYLQLAATGQLPHFILPTKTDDTKLQPYEELNYSDNLNASILDDQSFVPSGVQRLREGVFINETLNQLKAFFLQNTYNVAKLDTKNPEMRSIVATYAPQTQTPKDVKLPIMWQYVNNEINKEADAKTRVQGYDESTAVYLYGSEKVKKQYVTGNDTGGVNCIPLENNYVIVTDRNGRLGDDEVIKGTDSTLPDLEDLPQEYDHTNLLQPLKFGIEEDEKDETHFLTILRRVVCGSERQCLHTKGKFMLVNTLKDDPQKKQYAIQSLQFMDSLNPRSDISRKIMGQNAILKTFLKDYPVDDDQQTDTTPYIRFKKGKGQPIPTDTVLSQGVWSLKQILDIDELKDEDEKKKWTVHRVSSTARGLYPIQEYMGTWDTWTPEYRTKALAGYYRLEYTSKHTIQRIVQSKLMKCLQDGSTLQPQLPDKNEGKADLEWLKKPGKDHGIVSGGGRLGGGGRVDEANSAVCAEAASLEAASLEARAMRVARLWLDISHGAAPTADQTRHLAQLLQA